MLGKPLQFPETPICDIDKEKSIATSSLNTIVLSLNTSSLNTTV